MALTPNMCRCRGPSRLTRAAAKSTSGQDGAWAPGLMAPAERASSGSHRNTAATLAQTPAERVAVRARSTHFASSLQSECAACGLEAALFSLPPFFFWGHVYAHLCACACMCVHVCVCMKMASSSDSIVLTNQKRFKHCHLMRFSACSLCSASRSLHKQTTWLNASCLLLCFVVTYTYAARGMLLPGLLLHLPPLHDQVSEEVAPNCCCSV
jgi:hypothetical protein